MPGRFRLSDLSFDEWVTVFAAYLGAHYEHFKFLAEEITALGTSVSDWRAALDAHATAQATALQKTEAKDAARAALEALLAGYVLRVEALPGLTNDERLALGLHVRDTQPTPVGAPTTRPTLQVATDRGQHTLTFWDATPGAGRGKPAGVRAAQIWVKVGEAPASPEELRYLAEDTASPYVATWEATDAGKMAYYQLRWVNPRGEAGPWSEVVSAMITR